MLKRSDKSRLVCVFAHPDDEAFGPSGTIAKYSQTREVNLICVTNGNDKANRTKNLISIRKRELRGSAKILGVKSVYFLNYEDGQLCNDIYHKVAGKIERILKELKPDTLLTFELRGVSGHLDHVFCSMVTSYLFMKLPFVKTLLYYVANYKVSKQMSDYFIFFPSGYKETEVDKVIDVSEYWDLKLQAIQAHKSQIKDGEGVLKMLKKLPKKELFLILKK